VRKVSAFSRRLGAAWRQLNLPFELQRTVVAVSGGADSTALLLALDEMIGAEKLKTKLIVAHLDHGLRRSSRADARWVEELAQQLGHKSEIARLNAKQRAGLKAGNLEQGARRARYEFMARIARQEGAQLVLTAHTLNDQAETVLLRLLRGSGAEGLAGIEPVRRFAPGVDFHLARPLVTWARRRDTENYCQQKQTDFRVDTMNDDEQFARVRVRRQLVPLMETFNLKIVEALARTAELSRDDLAVLNQSAAALLQKAVWQGSANKSETNVPRLDVSVLANAPPALRRRALRQWICQARGDLRRFELVHIVGVEALLEGDRGGRVAELPGGARILRKRGWLELVKNKLD
jgi:tRNA(Ile)-lysidine synthase